MIEYKLLFPEQYGYLVTEEVQEEIEPYMENLIKDIFSDDILKKDLQIKKIFIIVQKMIKYCLLQRY